MQIPKNFEQAICIMLILAIQKDHVVISSNLISKRLGLSDTYTKKIINKLVKSGLAESEAGKYGGVKIGEKQLDTISLLDIYKAVVSENTLFQTENLAQKVFIDPIVISEKQNIIVNEMNRIQNEFFESLAKFTLDNVMNDRDFTNGYIDWYEITN